MAIGKKVSWRLNEKRGHGTIIAIDREYEHLGVTYATVVWDDGHSDGYNVNELQLV